MRYSRNDAALPPDTQALTTPIAISWHHLAQNVNRKKIEKNTNNTDKSKKRVKKKIKKLMCVNAKATQ